MKTRTITIFASIAVLAMTGMATAQYSNDNTEAVPIDYTSFERFTDRLSEHPNDNMGQIEIDTNKITMDTGSAGFCGRTGYRRDLSDVEGDIKAVRFEAEASRDRYAGTPGLLVNGEFADTFTVDDQPNRKTWERDTYTVDTSDTDVETIGFGVQDTSSRYCDRADHELTLDVYNTELVVRQSESSDTTASPSDLSNDGLVSQFGGVLRGYDSDDDGSIDSDEVVSAVNDLVEGSERISATETVAVTVAFENDVGFEPSLDDISDSELAAQYGDVLREYDADNSGSIGGDEVVEAINDFNSGQVSSNKAQAVIAAQERSVEFEPSAEEQVPTSDLSDSALKSQYSKSLRKFDADGSGTIGPDEAVNAVDEFVSDQLPADTTTAIIAAFDRELQFKAGVVQEYDRNGDGSISLDELGEASSDYANDKLTEQKLRVVQNAFSEQSSFDIEENEGTFIETLRLVDDDGSGTIGIDELGQAGVAYDSGEVDGKKFNAVVSAFSNEYEFQATPDDDSNPSYNIKSVSVAGDEPYSPGESVSVRYDTSASGPADATVAGDITVSIGENQQNVPSTTSSGGTITNSVSVNAPEEPGEYQVLVNAQADNQDGADFANGGTITVAAPGLVEQYDVDGDGVISIPELADAGSDYDSGDITRAELGTVIDAHSSQLDEVDLNVVSQYDNNDDQKISFDELRRAIKDYNNEKIGPAKLAQVTKSYNSPEVFSAPDAPPGTSVVNFEIPEGWSIVSAPRGISSLDSNGVPPVKSQIESECSVGTSGRTVWRARADVDGYAEPGPIRSTGGYWVNLESSCSFFTLVDANLPGDASYTEFEESGLYMVSVPEATSLDSVAGSCSFDQFSEYSGPVLELNGDEYQGLSSSTELSPTKGYWVGVQEPCQMGASVESGPILPPPEPQ